MSEKDADSAAAAHLSDGRDYETGAVAAHTKLKSRHLYMIAVGGERYPSVPFASVAHFLHREKPFV